MKIEIIGAGSIGLLFAAYLCEDFDVLIYTRTPEQADEINQNGIVLKKEGRRTQTFLVSALPISEWAGAEDFTIVAVKQYQLEAVIEKMNELPKLPVNVLFLQNGMGHLRLLEKLQARNLFVGSVEHGAFKENPHTVSHNGDGVTNAAVFKGESGRLKQFAGSVNKAFPVILKENYYEMLRNKLIVNAVINPLTAVLHVNNGELIKNSFYQHAARLLFTEISSILKVENQDEYLKQVFTICEKTTDNRSSMLKDLEAGRQTEVDAILGFLLDEANKQEKKAPLLESLFDFVKGKELERGGLS